MLKVPIKLFGFSQQIIWKSKVFNLWRKHSNIKCWQRISEEHILKANSGALYESSWAIFHSWCQGFFFFHFNTAFIWVGIPGMIYCGYWCNLFALHIFLTEYGNLLAPSSQPKMKGEVWKINACLLLQHTCVFEIQAVIHNWHSAMIYSQYYHSISFCRKQFHPLGKRFFFIYSHMS